MYSRRNAIAALVGVVLAAAAFAYATRLFESTDPPTSNDLPALLINGRAEHDIPHVDRFSADLTVTAIDCKNPVHAVLMIRLEAKPGRPRRAQFTDMPGTFRGQILDPSRSVHDVHAAFVSRREWDGIYSGAGEKFTDLPTVVARPHEERANAVTVDRDWTSSGKEFHVPVNGWFLQSGERNRTTYYDLPILRVDFEADWISERGFKTCFVRFPNLSSNPVPPGERELRPGSGVVTLSHSRGTTIDVSDSIPPPNDSRGPTWTCDLGAGFQNRLQSNCAGVAVLETPNADRDLQLRILVVGAVMGLALALVIEALLSFREPESRSRNRRR